MRTRIMIEGSLGNLCFFLVSQEKGNPLFLTSQKELNVYSQIENIHFKKEETSQKELKKKFFELDLLEEENKNY